MKDKIYLDNAASSEPSKVVLKAIKPFLSGYFGNPSSLHEYGRKSRIAIESSREDIAKILNCNPKEIVFTSGGTESINLAILGVVKSYQTKQQKPGHMIVSSIEHEAVLETVKSLKSLGWKIDYLNVDEHGFINPNDIKKLVRKDTALISVMYTNNEVGTIQPISELGKIISGINKVRNQKNISPIYFHTDACQAGGVLDLNVHNLKVDLLTLNGSKVNGPKGSGLLFIKTGTKIEPIIYGGGQERGLRSGTENILSIVGLATALKFSQSNRNKSVQKLLELQKFLETNLTKHKLIKINGPKNLKQDPKENNFNLQKLPGTINFSVKGIEGEALMYYLDGQGFAVATGSACTAGSEDPSHVLLAMGLKPDLAKSTIRLSLSYDTTKQQLIKFVNVLFKTIDLIKNTKQEL
jgi:cysteine desulfurase